MKKVEKVNTFIERLISKEKSSLNACMISQIKDELFESVIIDFENDNLSNITYNDIVEIYNCLPNVDTYYKD